MFTNGIGSLKPSSDGLVDILPVAVDTMGGDHGLGVQVEGAVLAFKEFGVKSILVGPEAEIRSKLESLGSRDLPLTVCNASDVITMDEILRALIEDPDEDAWEGMTGEELE